MIDFPAIIAGVLIFIPITGGLIISRSIKVMELNPFGNQDNRGQIPFLNGIMENIKRKATRVFVVMVIALFIVAGFLDISVLGGGFFMVIIGAICSFAGQLIAASQMKSIR